MAVVHIERLGVNIYKHRLDAVPQERMRGGHKGIGRGDDLARNAQSLQCGDQRNGAVGEKRNVLYPQVLAQHFFQLVVKWATVGQHLAVPYFLQIGHELFQGWKVWLRYQDR